MIESLPHSRTEDKRLYITESQSPRVFAVNQVSFSPSLEAWPHMRVHSSCFVYIMALLAQNNCASVSGVNRAVCFHEDAFGMYGNFGFRLENQRAAL